MTANALRFLLLPFSWLYAGAVIIRNKFFDWGFLRSEKLGAPTISVGNLSVGGTGKTPLVAYVVRYLQRKGKRVAILSRGYKRKSVGFVLVSDGKRILADAAQSGDEPQELAQHLPGVIVAVEENRARAGQEILEKFSIDVFVLDDGFQHRWVKRDLDIVTMPIRLDEQSAWFGVPRPLLLPAGRLREPLWSLRRAQHIVFTRAKGLESNPKLFENLKDWYRQYSSADVSAVGFRARTLVRLSDWKEEEPVKFGAKKAFLFCGIENPDDFSRLATSSGFVVVERSTFPDHYRYRAQDILNLKNRFATCGAEFLLTTMKDAARLSGTSEGRAFASELPVYALAIDLQFIHGEQTFHQHLDRLFV